MIMVMIEEGSGEGKERGGRSKKGKLKRNSNARRGLSQKFLSVRGGPERQEKLWREIWGSSPQGQRGLRISPIISR